MSSQPAIEDIPVITVLDILIVKGVIRSPEDRKHRNGNWTDEPCFYVAATIEVEEGTTAPVALLAGPFLTKIEASEFYAQTVALARERSKRANDPNDYKFVIALNYNGYREGLFNKELEL